MTPVLLLRRVGRYVADNAIAVLALIIATSGAAYAANTIGSSDIIDDSILSADIKNATITRSDMAWARWQQVGAGSPSNCANGAIAEFCNDYEDEFVIPRWMNYGSGFQGARFRRNATGEVTLQGLVRAESYPTFPIFFLPAGHRPAQALIFVVARGDGSGDTFGEVQIDPNGAVIFRGGSSNAVYWLSLTGISFPTG